MNNTKKALLLFLTLIIVVAIFCSGIGAFALEASGNDADDSSFFKELKGNVYAKILPDNSVSQDHESVPPYVNNPNDKVPDSGRNPQTGDNRNITLWLILAVVSMLALILTYRRNNKTN